MFHVELLCWTGTFYLCYAGTNKEGWFYEDDRDGVQSEEAGRDSIEAVSVQAIAGAEASSVFRV